MTDRPVDPFRGPLHERNPPDVPAGPPGQVDIEVDHDRCVGNGMCLTFAPGVFAHNPRRQSMVVDPEGDAFEDIMVAAENCPTAAITVRDAVTGEVYEV